MILVLGGTKEGREVMEGLSQRSIDFRGTVTTQYGKKLVSHLGEKVLCVALEESDMKELIHKYQVDCIVDCTHPFATVISELAMKVAEEEKVSYIRYERPSLEEVMEKEQPSIYEQIKWVKSYEEAGRTLASFDEPVLSTIGGRRLHLITDRVNPKLVVARVLPDVQSLEDCQRAGIKKKNILAMQGPFSEAFNKAVYEAYGIKAVIMKESGQVGGTIEKIQSALEVGVLPVVIKRPPMEYKQVVQDIEILLNVLSKRA